MVYIYRYDENCAKQYRLPQKPNSKINICFKKMLIHLYRLIRGIPADLYFLLLALKDIVVFCFSLLYAIASGDILDGLFAIDNATSDTQDAEQRQMEKLYNQNRLSDSFSATYIVYCQKMKNAGQIV